MDEETLNVLDGTQDQVVDGQETGAETGAVVEGEEGSTETLETGTEGIAKPQQTPEQNAAFAAARREAEAQAKAAEERLAAAEAREKRLLQALSPWGYEGSADEVADYLFAVANDITPEQARAQREADEAAAAQRAAEQEEKDFYKNEYVKAKMKEDLAAIQSIDPTVKSLESLGEEFVKAMQATDRDAIMAYQLYQMKQNAVKKPVPADIGGINENSGTAEKEYYTPSDVDKLTDADYERDPKLWDKVRASMLKGREWRT